MEYSSRLEASATGESHAPLLPTLTHNTHCLYTVLGPTRPHLSMTGMSRSGVQGQARARLRHHSCMPAYILMMAV